MSPSVRRLMETGTGNFISKSARTHNFSLMRIPSNFQVCIQFGGSEFFVLRFSLSVVRHFCPDRARRSVYLCVRLTFERVLLSSLSQGLPSLCFLFRVPMPAAASRTTFLCVDFGANFLRAENRNSFISSPIHLLPGEQLRTEKYAFPLLCGCHEAKETQTATSK